MVEPLLPGLILIRQNLIALGRIRIMTLELFVWEKQRNLYMAPNQNKSEKKIKFQFKNLLTAKQEFEKLKPYR